MAKFIINLINKPGGMKTINGLAKSLNKKPGNLIKSAFKKTTGRKGKTIKTMTPRSKTMTRKDERIERNVDDLFLKKMTDEMDRMERVRDGLGPGHPIWGIKGIDW